MTAEVIAVANRKGGVGKTATVSCISSGLLERGYKVLLVDMDSQRNLTSSCYNSEKEVDSLDVTTADLLRAKGTAQQAIQHTDIADLIPASKQLSLMETELAQAIDKNYRLRNALEPLRATYDFIMIDCPPSLGICTINALTACDSVIVPSECDEMSINGISDLLSIVNTVKKYTNPDIQVKGVLITRFKGRTQLHKQKLEEIRKRMRAVNVRTFRQPIRESISISEVRSIKHPVMSLYDYADKRNNAIKDYNAVIDELLEK